MSAAKIIYLLAFAFSTFLETAAPSNPKSHEKLIGAVKSQFPLSYGYRILKQVLLDLVIYSSIV